MPGYAPLANPTRSHFSLQAQAIFEEHRQRVIIAMKRGETRPVPESIVLDNLDNTWHDSAEAILNNWIGKVYQLTHIDRDKPFQDDIDPDDPLGLRRR